MRALRIGDPADVALLQVVARGEFATTGFRNRDLRRHLFPGSDDLPREQIRRLSARVSRMLRLLRAHGLIHKIQKTHRYRLTVAGQRLTAALDAVRNSTIGQLLRSAA